MNSSFWSIMSYKQVKRIANNDCKCSKQYKGTRHHTNLRWSLCSYPVLEKLERLEKFQRSQSHARKWSDQNPVYKALRKKVENCFHGGTRSIKANGVRKDIWDRTAMEKELSYEKGVIDSFDYTDRGMPTIEPMPYHSDADEFNDLDESGELDLGGYGDEDYYDNLDKMFEEYEKLKPKPVSQDILDIFQEAQDMIFNDSADIHTMGMSKQEAMYGNGDFTAVPDVLERQLSKKTYGMDSGGSLALENMFDPRDEPKLSVLGHYRIKK